MTRYLRKASVEAAPLGEETLLYDPDARRFCQLNATAACVWEQLERASTADEISGVIRNRFSVAPGAHIDADVTEALRVLIDLQLVEPASDAWQATNSAPRSPGTGGHDEPR